MPVPSAIKKFKFCQVQECKITWAAFLEASLLGLGPTYLGSGTPIRSVRPASIALLLTCYKRREFTQHNQIFPTFVNSSRELKPACARQVEDSEERWPKSCTEQSLAAEGFTEVEGLTFQSQAELGHW